jgi:hypothetical protein
MREDLAITIRYPESLSLDAAITVNFKISGQQLLLWLKERTDALAAQLTVPATTGLDEAQAWVLDSRDAFVTAWITLRRDEAAWKRATCYFKVGGRVIQKSPADVAHGGVLGGHAEGYYMRDAVLSGAVPGGAAVWVKADGASYVDFAKTVSANMSTSGNHTDTDDGHIAWSQAKAQKLRNVLKGAADFHAKGADSTSAFLPLLAAVMFIAEPARNPRSFGTALMMLDMIGENYSHTGQKYYTLDKVLGHPERINPPGVAGKPQLGPTGRGATGNTVGYALIPTKLKDRKTALARVEGKFSATPSGSARTLDAIDIASDYIQKKEASILVRWLSRMLQPAPGGPARSGEVLTIEALRSGDVAVRQDFLATGSLAAFLPPSMSPPQVLLYNQIFTGLKVELEAKIKALILSRLSSFDAM